MTPSDTQLLTLFSACSMASNIAQSGKALMLVMSQQVVLCKENELKNTIIGYLFI